MEGHVVPKKDTFSYLGTMGTYHHIDEDVIHKVKTGLSAILQQRNREMVIQIAIFWAHPNQQLAGSETVWQLWPVHSINCILSNTNNTGELHSRNLM